MAAFHQHSMSCLQQIRNFVKTVYPEFLTHQFDYGDFEPWRELFSQRGDITPKQQLEFFLNVLEKNIFDLEITHEYDRSNINNPNIQQNVSLLQHMTEKFNESLKWLNMAKDIRNKTMLQGIQGPLERLRQYVGSNFGNNVYDKKASEILRSDERDHQKLFRDFYQELYNLQKDHPEITPILQETKKLILVPLGMILINGEVQKNRGFDPFGNEF